MNDANMGGVIPLLRRVGLGGARDRLLRDKARLAFVNQTRRSRDRVFSIDFTGKMADVPLIQLAANPHGLYQVLVSPARYRQKSLFLNVRSGRPSRLEMEFFIRASKAKARFPSFEAIQEGGRWADLAQVFRNSGTDRAAYEGLSDKQKGTLFNIHAKTQSLELSTGTVFTHIQRIVGIQEERVFFRAEPELLGRIAEDPSVFRRADGTLHTGFSEGFERADSFKTPEGMGNLQLTFARNAAGELEVDADLDDHQGILHAFDVLRHTLTGDKTHPFDIHQVLRRFHNIDPGYTLS